MGTEFAKYIQTKEIRFKHAKGMRDIIGKEMHTYHEIFLFLGGDAEFVSEQGSKKLSPFTTVVIPKNTFHSFIVHGAEEDYCRCVLNFDSVFELDALIEEKLKNIFFTEEENISSLFLKMRDAESSSLPEREKGILLKAFFAELLVSLKEQGASVFENPVSPLTDRAITFINENLAERLTAKDLARALHISDSYLSHVFKKEMRISVHKYILEKRLILADKKIKGGMPAMQAAAESGFLDYSGFHKQFKKMFGKAPTRRKSGK